MSSSSGPVLIGVIGGSGLYHLDNLTLVETVNPETPWGKPSSPIHIFTLPCQSKIAFLTRHGPGHTISPSHVPSLANISALKSLGVKVILAFSAVGSLREEIKPGSFVIPDQIIDRTKGIRKSSFFGEVPPEGEEGGSVVAHAGFGDPFSVKFSKWLERRVKRALETYNQSREEGKEEVELFTEKCIVCMEGPQFSTRAESKMYRQWGGDIINMSVLPEAKLAREAELSYALIATSTDYDAWRPNEEPVTAAEVFKTLSTNANVSRYVCKEILSDLHKAIQPQPPSSQHRSEGEAALGDVEPLSLEELGSMKYSIMPRSQKQNKEVRRKLAFVLPEYFDGDEE